MLLHRKVDGRKRHPVVRDGKVELDSEGGPCPAISDERFLDGGVRVEHVPARPFIQTAVHVAAEIRQHGQAQVLVLEMKGAPADGFARVRQGVAQRIWIVEATELEQIERRIRIRGAFRIGGDFNGVLPDADSRHVRRAARDRRGAHDQDRQKPD